MLIDACMYVGHYPFRKTEIKTAAELVALMDSYQIDRALVSSIQGVYYRDVMEGNLELFEEIAPFRDRLIPLMNGNPRYPCAIEDLERCVQEFDCRAVRLFPGQHGYNLTDDCSVSYLQRAASLGIPAALPIYLEDLRGRHNLDIMFPLPAADIRAAALLAPETDFIIHNYANTAYSGVLSEIASKRTGSFYYDFGRSDNMYGDTLQTLISQAGLEHILFATGAPLQYIDPQLVKLHFLPQKGGLTPDQVELITSGNAKRLFKLS